MIKITNLHRVLANGVLAHEQNERQPPRSRNLGHQFITSSYHFYVHDLKKIL